MSTALSESCTNTVEEEDATHRTSTSPGLKGLCYRKENTFQQRPGPGILSFALSLAWEHFLSQLSKTTALLLLLTLTGNKGYPLSQWLM